MRPLQIFVLGESLLVVVLGLFWLLGDPPPAEAAGDRTASVAEDTDRRQPGRLTASPSGDENADPVGRSPALERTRSEAPVAAGDGVLVHGRLSARGDKPGPEDANVVFRRGGGYRAATEVDRDYAVAGLQPGPWEVHVRADGFAEYRREHEISGEAVQRLDLVLDPAHRVDVYLRTPSGEQIEAALRRGRFVRSLTVIATEQPLTGDLPATDNTTVGDVGLGRYRSAWSRVGEPMPEPGEPDGELQIDRPPPVNAALVFRHVVLAQQPIAPGQHELTFTLGLADVEGKFGTVELRLIDGITGQPITENATARVSSAQGGGTFGRPDADGHVRVADVLPGLTTLIVNAKDRAGIWTLVRVPPGGTVDLGDLVLSPPVEIEGRLIGPDGEPMSGSVQWTDLGTMTFPRELVNRRSTSADGEGKFTVREGPCRVVLIARTPDGLRGHAVVDARAGPPEPVEIHMASPVDVVVDAVGDPLAGYTLTIRDRQGVPVAAYRLEARWRQAKMSVPPGDYVLEVHGERDELVTRVPLRARAETIRLEVP